MMSERVALAIIAAIVLIGVGGTLIGWHGQAEAERLQLLNNLGSMLGGALGGYALAKASDRE